MKKYILVYDSGKGGENVLKVLKKVFPKENFLLFCDKQNAPFGNKRKDELEKILFTAIFSLTKKYPTKAIVIACNTMSSLFKRELKKTYPNVFCIEPMISKRILKSHTLVLATQSTIKNSEKLKKYKSYSTYHEVAFKTLATKIDNTNNLHNLVPYLRENLSPYFYCKNIVLACTHYTSIKPQLTKLFSHKVFFYDSSFLTAQKLKKIMPYTKK